MKFVQEWCKGKPPILRIVAKVTAFGPEDLHWGLERLYQRDLPNVFPVPADPIVWHACYNRETALVDCFLRLLFNDDQYVFRRLK